MTDLMTPRRDSLVRFTRVGDRMVGEIPQESLLEAERLNAYGTKHEAPLSEFRRGFEQEHYARALRMGRYNVLGQVGMDLQQPSYHRVLETHWPYKDTDASGYRTTGVYEPGRNRALVRETSSDAGRALGHEMTHAGMQYMAGQDRHRGYRFSDTILARLLGIPRDPEPVRIAPQMPNDHTRMSAMDDLPMPADVPRLMEDFYRAKYPPDEQSRAKAEEWIARGQQLLAEKRPRGPR